MKIIGVTSAQGGHGVQWRVASPVPEAERDQIMTDAVRQAAIWLVTTPDNARPRPLIPFLRAEFGLSVLEAVKAIEESHRIKETS